MKIGHVYFSVTFLSLSRIHWCQNPCGLWNMFLMWMVEECDMSRRWVWQNWHPNVHDWKSCCAPNSNLVVKSTLNFKARAFLTMTLNTGNKWGKIYNSVSFTQFSQHIIKFTIHHIPCPWVGGALSELSDLLSTYLRGGSSWFVIEIVPCRSAFSPTYIVWTGGNCALLIFITRHKPNARYLQLWNYYIPISGALVPSNKGLRAQQNYTLVPNISNIENTT